MNFNCNHKKDPQTSSLTPGRSSDMVNWSGGGLTAGDYAHDLDQIKPRTEVLFKGRFPKRQQIPVSDYSQEGNGEEQACYQNM